MAIWYLNEAVRIHANGPTTAATASASNVVPIHPPPTAAVGVAERESAVADVSITDVRAAPLAGPPARRQRSPRSARAREASRSPTGSGRRILCKDAAS